MKYQLLNKSVAAVTLILALIVSVPGSVSALCNVDSNGTYIEAEDYTGSDNLDGDPDFDDEFEEKVDSEANGGKVLVSGNNGYASNTPHHAVKKYEVNFSTTGTYYIWARARAEGWSSSRDSMFFTVDNDNWKAWNLRESHDGATFYWNDNMQVGSGNTIEISSAGTHTIKIAMRERDAVIDGFFLVHEDSNFTPTDTTVPGSVTTISPKNGCSGSYWDVQPGALGPTSFRGYNAEDMTFTITNTGNDDGNTTATITSDETWVVVNNSTMPALGIGETHTATVSFNTASLSAGTHTAEITIAGGGNIQNSGQTVEVTLLVKDIPSTAACGEIPLYAENLINPAIMVLLDTSGSMDSWMYIGYGQYMRRIDIAEDVLKEVFQDRSIAWGFGTWAGGRGNASDSDDSPDYYTNYHIGVHTHDETHQTALQDKADDGYSSGWTPLAPAMRGGLEYFKGNRDDNHYNEPYDSVSCQPRIVVIITDGLGNTGTNNTKIDNVVDDLIDEGITVVAVGFGLSNADQLDRIVEKMQTAGELSDEDYLYHLHNEDSNGDAEPFMAQNRDEFIAAMNSIVTNVKAQVFHGASPAPTTSVDNGAILLNAEFDASDWSGNITATQFDTFTGALNATPTWETQDNMPATINGFIYDSSAGPTGYVSTYTDASISGDNFLCKPMGDIINSTPAIVGSPPYYYHFDDYFNYKYDENVNNRDEIAYVGANDGALHAFRISDGSEKWRFYPESVQAEMAKATSSPQDDMCSASYCHKFLVDGSPEPADVYVNSSTKWRTILTTGLGEGGSAFFALDVTYGEGFDASNVGAVEVKSKFLWEFTDSELGFATSWPTTVRVKEAFLDATGWATYFGSGQAATELLQADKEAYLFALASYDKGKVWVDSSNNPIYRMKLTSATLKNDQPSPPIAIDTQDDDDIYDRIYLGNLYGDFYRVKDIGYSQTPVSEVLFDSELTDHQAPVTAKAGFAYAGDGDIWLYFGTGKYTDQIDKFTTYQQYFMGLFDENAATATAYTKSDLVEFTTDIISAYAVDEDGNKVDLTGDGSVDADDLNQYRTLSCTSPINGVCNPTNASWILKLAVPSGTGSERVISQPLVVGGIVFFTTFVPDGDVCQGNGDTWLFAVDYETGDFVTNEVFDINNNDEFDSGDTKVVDTSGNEQKIGGVYIGTGKPSGELVIYNDILYVGTTNEPPKAIKVNLPAQRTRLRSWQQKLK